MDVIARVREEILQRIEQYESQKGKHAEDVMKLKEKIKKAKEKEYKLQKHLEHEKDELSKIDEYLKWRT